MHFIKAISFKYSIKYFRKTLKFFKNRTVEFDNLVSLGVIEVTMYPNSGISKYKF